MQEKRFCVDSLKYLLASDALSGYNPPVMMQTQSRIGVVIVSYNTCALLRGCLESLKQCAVPLQIVVVVDNGSTDGSQALVTKQFAEVRLLEPGSNLGFGAANNLAINQLLAPSADKPDYVLLLNADTVVQPGAIEALVCFLEAHPRVGLVGPQLRNLDGSIQTAAFRFPTLSMAVLDLFPPGEVLPGRLYNSWWHGRYLQEQAAHPAPFPIDHPLGACMLVRRGTLAGVKGFDPRYFMYSEEIDLCWRIRAAGWAIWQVPAAQVVHYGGASTSQFRQQMLVALYRSRVQFAAQHRGRGFQLAHWLILTFGMLRASVRTWHDYSAARISRDDLRTRLWAFGKIMQTADTRRQTDDQ